MSDSQSARAALSYAVGVDIGGTFTDATVVTPRGVVTAKTPTTPDDPSQGFFNSIDAAAHHLGLSGAELMSRCRQLIHGTTIGTNALVNRTGAKTGLVTTAGHGDVMLLMKGGGRTVGLPPEGLLDPFSTGKPVPIVPRSLVVEVQERIDVTGAVVVALDLDSARRGIGHLLEQGVQSIAISLLWSIRNPEHERAVKQLVSEMSPATFVTCASELISRVGEYERTTTAVINAYLGPLMTDYVDSINVGSAKRGYTGKVLFVQCAGGALTAEEVQLSPIRTLDSGPVSGVVAATRLAAGIEHDDLLTADMGGTTFDVAIIRGRQPLNRDTTIYQQYELALPAVDIESVGAGGGSVAWIDELGRLNVGPKSAGARPGPACYGRGGVDATVTDADVVLGIIDPALFNSGEMTIAPDLSWKAIDRLAERLGLDVPATAASINRIVDARMADLIRRMSVQRGYDPRTFALLAFGGGGPVHAAAIATQADIHTVIVPPTALASVWSSYGAAVADVVHMLESALQIAVPCPAHEVGEPIAALECRILEQFEAEGWASDRVVLQCWLRMRHNRQTFTVDVPFTLPVTDRAMDDLPAAFVATYEARFGPGSSYPAGGLEIVGARVRGSTELGVHVNTENTEFTPAQNAVTARTVYWQSAGRYVDTPVLRAYGPDSGQYEGPMLIELPGTVAVIGEGQRARFDANGSLIITKSANSGSSSR